MKLIYRISLRLSFVLLPLIALWAAFFYFRMVDEINDETDDALGDYSELIIIRMLAGQPLPQLNEGSNNNYSITPIDEAYASSHPHIDYYDADVFIPEKDETEPARILTTIFQDKEGLYYELKVATPTFEKEDLIKTILSWVIFLYIVLLVTIISITLWVFHKSMAPLYALLKWLDEYTPGHRSKPLPNDTGITEFRRLNAAAQQAVNRAEDLNERQKQFIGNASHELQTPLSVLGNRLDWILDHTDPSEQQLEELLKMRHTLDHAVRLNKTLLLLTKIDNGQFPESTDIDIAMLIREQQSIYDEIFATRAIQCTMELPAIFKVHMNESLASILITNLLKNAYVHSANGAKINILIKDKTLTVSNQGDTPLDKERIFERFYQGSKKEGSTGLGLALVSAVSNYYKLRLNYYYNNGYHNFTISWK